MASWRSASIVTQVPMECPMMSIRRAPDWASSRSVASSWSRATLALSLS
jgi:hypothetical protein